MNDERQPRAANTKFPGCSRGRGILFHFLSQDETTDAIADTGLVFAVIRRFFISAWIQKICMPPPVFFFLPFVARENELDADIYTYTHIIFNPLSFKEKEKIIE